MMLRGLHHVSISTPDLDAMLAFYNGLLGFKIVAQAELAPDSRPELSVVVGLERAHATVCFLHVGNAYLEIFQYHAPEGRPPERNRPVVACGITHLCIDVDDVDFEYERLKAAGVRFHCEPQFMRTTAKTTYARDPDDNIVEFQQLLGLQNIIRMPDFQERLGDNSAP